MSSCTCGLGNPNPRAWATEDRRIYIDLELIQWIQRSMGDSYISNGDGPFHLTDAQHASLVDVLMVYRSGR